MSAPSTSTVSKRGAPTSRRTRCDASSSSTRFASGLSGASAGASLRYLAYAFAARGRSPARSSARASFHVVLGWGERRCASAKRLAASAYSPAA